MSLWLSASVSFFLSFVSKLVADSFLEDRIPILGSFAGLQMSHNSGVAFGVRLPGDFQLLFILIALLGVFLLALRTARSTPSRVGYGLILGGALGNIADRLPDGLVTDFFQVGTFPIFNVADSCITIGAIFLILEGLLLHSRRNAQS